MITVESKPQGRYDYGVVECIWEIVKAQIETRESKGKRGFYLLLPRSV